jgi:hypothetical protein
LKSKSKLKKPESKIKLDNKYDGLTEAQKKRNDELRMEV